MEAAVCIRPGKIGEKPMSVAGTGEALIKITTTTICGTDRAGS
jgi:alcohol dehydrogenase